MNDRSKKSRSSRAKAVESELEYYDLTQYPTADKERDSFFDNLVDDDSHQDENFSSQPPVCLDKFYRNKKADKSEQD